MITIAASGTPNRTQKYLHTRRQVSATTSLNSATTDCCFCSCETEIPVFAYLTDTTDNDRNDFFSWIWKLPANSTAVLTLTNLDTGTDYAVNSSTYGKYYALGSLKANVLGVVIQWYKVASVIGYGNYQLNITVENGASDEIMNKDYPRFRLMPYTCENVHGTVRVETYNTGYIEGGFDYRDMDLGLPFKGVHAWGQQIRYYGRLDLSNIPTEIDNNFDTQRNLNQIQTQIYNEWNLRLEFMNSDISKQVIYDNLLADYILLSDYNANNVEEYRNIKTSLLNIETPQPFLNKTSLFNVKFVDYKQDLLKRHY